MISPSEEKSKICNYCGNELTRGFELNAQEVQYLVDSIQHEYLSKDTYYFASGLFGRMAEFLKKNNDELARRDSQTT